MFPRTLSELRLVLLLLLLQTSGITGFNCDVWEKGQHYIQSLAFISKGCSMSSATGTVARKLLNAMPGVMVRSCTVSNLNVSHIPPPTPLLTVACACPAALQRTAMQPACSTTPQNAVRRREHVAASVRGGVQPPPN